MSSLPCNVEIAEQFLEASDGLVKFFGIAPEDNEDYLEFIEEMKGKVNISFTTVLIQSARFVAEPAIAPSDTNVARFPTTLTSNPPSVYCPSGIPVARMLS